MLKEISVKEMFKKIMDNMFMNPDMKVRIKLMEEISNFLSIEEEKRFPKEMVKQSKYYASYMAQVAEILRKECGLSNTEALIESIHKDYYNKLSKEFKSMYKTAYDMIKEEL